MHNPAVTLLNCCVLSAHSQDEHVTRRAHAVNGTWRSNLSRLPALAKQQHYMLTSMTNVD